MQDRIVMSDIRMLEHDAKPVWLSLGANGDVAMPTSLCTLMGCAPGGSMLFSASR